MQILCRHGLTWLLRFLWPRSRYTTRLNLNVCRNVRVYTYGHLVILLLMLLLRGINVNVSDLLFAWIISIDLITIRKTFSGWLGAEGTVLWVLWMFASWSLGSYWLIWNERSFADVIVEKLVPLALLRTFAQIASLSRWKYLITVDLDGVLFVEELSCLVFGLLVTVNRVRLQERLFNDGITKLPIVFLSRMTVYFIMQLFHSRFQTINN